jgi:hypothetical protein
MGRVCEAEPDVRSFGCDGSINGDWVSHYATRLAAHH